LVGCYRYVLRFAVPVYLRCFGYVTVARTFTHRLRYVVDLQVTFYVVLLRFTLRLLRSLHVVRWFVYVAVVVTLRYTRCVCVTHVCGWLPRSHTLRLVYAVAHVYHTVTRCRTLRLVTFTVTLHVVATHVYVYVVVYVWLLHTFVYHAHVYVAGSFTHARTTALPFAYAFHVRYVYYRLVTRFAFTVVTHVWFYGYITFPVVTLFLRILPGLLRYTVGLPLYGYFTFVVTFTLRFTLVTLVVGCRCLPHVAGYVVGYTARCVYVVVHFTHVYTRLGYVTPPAFAVGCYCVVTTFTVTFILHVRLRYVVVVVTVTLHTTRLHAHCGYAFTVTVCGYVYVAVTFPTRLFCYTVWLVYVYTLRSSSRWLRWLLRFHVRWLVTLLLLYTRTLPFTHRVATHTHVCRLRLRFYGLRCGCGCVYVTTLRLRLRYGWLLVTFTTRCVVTHCVVPVTVLRYVLLFTLRCCYRLRCLRLPVTHVVDSFTLLRCLPVVRWLRYVTLRLRLPRSLRCSTLR